MYRIRNFYWKSVKNGATNSIAIVDPNDKNCMITLPVSAMGRSFGFAMTSAI